MTMGELAVYAGPGREHVLLEGAKKEGGLAGPGNHVGGAAEIVNLS